MQRNSRISPRFLQTALGSTGSIAFFVYQVSLAACMIYPESSLSKACPLHRQYHTLIMTCALILFWHYSTVVQMRRERWQRGGKSFRLRCSCSRVSYEASSSNLAVLTVSAPFAGSLSSSHSSRTSPLALLYDAAPAFWSYLVLFVWLLEVCIALRWAYPD